MEAITARPMTEDDIPATFNISLLAHNTDTYKQIIPTERYRDFSLRYTDSDRTRQAFAIKTKTRLNSPNWSAYVAVIGQVIVGFMLIERRRGVLVLNSIFVDPRHQSLGVGKLLMGKYLGLSQKGDKLRLTVLAGNEKAKQFYRKHGFSVIRTSERTYYGARQEIMERV